MATITPKRTDARPQDLDFSQRSVRSPLRSLRGKIRRYVITESLASLLAGLAVAFWILFTLDVGIYLWQGVDLVLYFPVWFRGMLLGLTLGLVCFFVELWKVAKLKRFEPAKGVPAPSILERVLENPWLMFGVVVPGLLLYLGAWIVLGVLRQQEVIGETTFALGIAVGLGLFAMLLVVKRMLYEFREVSLAMVLERRYPRLLGDRLLTAVELADPAKVRESGYSQRMVVQVIHEAAERVNRLSPSKVFDWPRLYWRGVLCALLTFGAYALVLAGVSIAAVANDASNNRKLSFVRSYHQFNDAAELWFQRYVLLRNVRYPDDPVLLEHVSAPDATYVIGRDEKVVLDKLREMKFVIPKHADAPKYALRVRALKWVVPDVNAKDGWRPLLWSDLGAAVPAGGDPPKIDVPAAWLEYQRYPPADESASLQKRVSQLSIDEIELLLERKSEPMSKEGQTALLAESRDAPSARGSRLLLEVDEESAWLRHGYDVRERLSGELGGEAAGQATLLTAGDLRALSVHRQYVPEIFDKITSVLPPDEHEKWNDSRDKIRAALDKLYRYYDYHPMTKTVRRLEAPKKVSLVYVDRKQSVTRTSAMTKVAGNALLYEHAFPTDLKDDSVPYRFAGDDYETDERRIDTVPNPIVRHVETEKVVPAYHYYDVSGFWPFNKYLAGLKQTARIYRPDEELGAVFGAAVAFFPKRDTAPPRVFEGGSIDLYAKVDRRLMPGSVLLLSEPEVPKVKDNAIGIDFAGNSTIRLSLEDLQEQRVRLRYAFRDHHGLWGWDQVVVLVDKDEKPQRSERNGFIQAKPLRLLRSGGSASSFRVTPNAILPFMFDVADDYGLYSLDYKYELKAELEQHETNRRGVQVAAAVGMFGGPTSGIGCRVYERLLKAVTSDLKRDAGTFAVPSAKQIIVEQRRFYQAQDIESLLKGTSPPDRPLYKDLVIKEPANWTDPSDLDEYLRNPDPSLLIPRGRRAGQVLSGMDLEVALPYLAAEEGLPQQHFTVEIWVETMDNNVEAAKRGADESRRWTFNVISESELLALIRKDELDLHKRLEDIYKKLEQEETKLEGDVKFLDQPLEENPDEAKKAFAVIADGMQMPAVLEDTRKTVTDVHNQYFQLYLEMRTNRVRHNIMKSRWDGILKPLSDFPDQATRDKEEAVKTLIGESRVQLEAFRRALSNPLETDVQRRRLLSKAEGDKALLEIAKLKRALALIMDRIRGFMEKKDLIAKLEEILKDQEEQLKAIQKREKDLIDSIFGKELGAP